MYTKQDFLDVIQSSVTQYPAQAALYQAGDPRILQAQQAIAQMLAMMSQQIEIGMMEPFSKTRDATVLADASLKGLIPMAVPSKVSIVAENGSQSSFSIDSGRVLLDSSGNAYVVDTPATIPAQGRQSVTLSQMTSRNIEHTVSISQPFYKIEVSKSTDAQKIAGISLLDSSGAEFRYSPEFTNVAPGDKVFNVETDEFQRIFVTFGYGGVAGYQPKTGEKFSVVVRETSGAIQVNSGSPFAFQYTYQAQDSLIKMSMSSQIVAGADPMDISTLRELCKYPSIYDASATFLGEFDFLIRRNIPNLQFLSVWNETLEEAARGASANNINKLFISFVEPEGSDRAYTQSAIQSVVSGADDSFRLAFIPAKVIPLGIVVSAQVARVNDVDAVKLSIKQALLEEFGLGAPATKMGMVVPKYQRVYEMLKKKVVALQDSGADFTVAISQPSGAALPENWCYMTSDSITVNVTKANYNLNGWGV